MKIYGSTISPFVRKAVVFAEEKGLAVELIPTAPGDTTPAFRAISPFGQIPAMVDDDFALADSSAIIAYLEAKHPDPVLIPADAQARGRTIWFDELADTVIFATGRTMLFNRVVGPLFRGVPGDAAAADAAERDQWPAILAYLEQAVTGRDFLVGDGFTLADIAVTSALASSLHATAPIEAAGHPELARYLDTMLARPAFARRLEAERGFIAKVRAKVGA
ncbi:glutathione S-transferase family protein [Sphingomonas sp. Leaf10]|uniref:glutathione S-transferase family protein n=1 Tax=Sphingomonas sp. Leaf10 TaxID=1735676 RepID=UPI0006FF2AB8|nr:glutathione S-transferase family protein [Sphingomonas sp. Leaf10]KQM31236.1 glutathione S-transferase [Sphingomonas sp. Leaf10]